MRKALAYLLAAEFGLKLRPVGSGKRVSFADGDQARRPGQQKDGFVSWVVRSSLWEPEKALAAELDLPLNMPGK